PLSYRPWRSSSPWRAGQKLLLQYIPHLLRRSQPPSEPQGCSPERAILDVSYPVLRLSLNFSRPFYAHCNSVAQGNDGCHKILTVLKFIQILPHTLIDRPVPALHRKVRLNQISVLKHVIGDQHASRGKQAHHFGEKMNILSLRGVHENKIERPLQT